MITAADIRNALKVVNKVKAAADGCPKYGYRDDFNVFISKMLCLTPQSYGARLEGYMIKQFGLRPSDEKDKGDFIDQFGGYHELKVSLLTPTNFSLNLVQIRPWQDVSYWCIAIDTRCLPYEEYIFALTKKQMEYELETMKATAAHGTQTANEHNQTVEKRMSLKIDSQDKDFQRWVEHYRRKIRLDKKVKIEVGK